MFYVYLGQKFIYFVFDGIVIRFCSKLNTSRQWKIYFSGYFVGTVTIYRKYCLVSFTVMLLYQGSEIDV